MTYSMYDRSVVAESLIEIEGHPFSLDDYPFYVDVYNKPYVRTLLKCGRQVAKSTYMCNRAIIACAAVPHYKYIYIAPSMSQAHGFSTSRLDPAMNFSPEIYSKYLSAGAVTNVSHKRWRNGAEIRVLYAQDNADRIRSYSSYEIDYDEVQDIVLSAVTPVANECMSNAPAGYGLEVYAGTPKSVENEIELMWKSSTQDEWIVQCTGCGSWNAPISPKHVGLTGVVCLKCDKLLNVRTGQWHSMNPMADDPKTKGTKGYHISQLIMPLNSEQPDRWARILHKLETYDSSKFLNEVLGVSDAVGSRMVGLHEMHACCMPYDMLDSPTQESLKDVVFTVAGVDWSGGGSVTYTSRSAVWIWGMLSNGVLKLLYYKIFPTHNPVQDVRAIAEIIQRFDCRKVAGDAGGGAVANAMLQEIVGAQRVMQVQYGAVTKQISWNGMDRYMVDKTSAIDTFMHAIKRTAVVFPRLKYMVPAFDDILSNYELITQNGKGRRVWRNSPLVPDDCLHAAVFGWVASKIEAGDVAFYPITYGS